MKRVDIRVLVFTTTITTCAYPWLIPLVKLSGCGQCVTPKMLMLFMFTVMGKAEGSVAREEWHGHVTALSVAPEFRRLGLAAKLMELLEEISEK